MTHETEMRPDHRAAAGLLRRALSWAHRQPAPPVRMYEVWTPLSQFDEPVDISDHLETKIAAVRAHASQCRLLRYDEAIRALNRYRGELHNPPGGDYAEVFATMR